MATLAFDSLRYARRLQEVGMPEPQADVLAELMVEAFGFYANNILTKDHFEAVLDARFDRRFTSLECRIGRLEERMDSVDASMQHLTRLMVRIERTQFVHSWILGIGVTALVVPQLTGWWV